MNLLTDSKNKTAYSSSMAKLEIDKEFANRFSSLVDSKGWSDLSRVKLGKVLGVSSTCAHFYIRGERLPAIDQARALCELFDGLCVEWLLTGKGPKYQNEQLNLNGYVNVSHLSPSRRQEADTYIKFLASQENNENNENNENKPLTIETENEGGGLKPATSLSRSNHGKAKTGA